jgi:hypothetical protein
MPNIRKIAQSDHPGSMFIHSFIARRESQQRAASIFPFMVRIVELNCSTGLPDFPRSEHTKTVQNDHKLYQTAIHYTKLQKNNPNGYKIQPHFTYQAPPKFTQIGIFGSRIKPSGNPVAAADKTGIT